MINIKYQIFCTDHGKHLEKNFQDLTELENWIFNQMRRSYSNMYFPIGNRKCPDQLLRMDCIVFLPVEYEGQYLIHEIENERGIIFSDGLYTNEQKHVSSEIKPWLMHCEERRQNPTFNFVD